MGNKNDATYSLLNIDSLEEIEKKFEMVQILNHHGEVKDTSLETETGLSDEDLIEIMRRMIFTRQFAKQTNSYSQQGRMGFYASSLGQEAAMIASHYAFDKEDWLYGGYRDIPQLIMHGASVADVYHWSLGHVKGSNFIAEKDIKATLPQIIIGAQMVQAQGNALGQKLKGSKNVTFAYTGDGGTSEGDTYEALNFAGVFQSPVVYFFQNNGYAISTPVEIQTHAETLAQKAVAAGIPGVKVDGNDPLASYLVSKQARQYAADGHGPVLIELVTNRMEPHSTMGDDPMRYRDEASLEYWAERDPIARFSKYLMDKNLFSPELEEEYKEEALEEIKEAMAECESVEKMSLPETLKWQYEEMPLTLREQYEALKGGE